MSVCMWMYNHIRSRHVHLWRLQADSSYALITLSYIHPERRHSAHNHMNQLLIYQFMRNDISREVINHISVPEQLITKTWMSNGDIVPRILISFSCLNEHPLRDIAYKVQFLAFISQLKILVRLYRLIYPRALQLIFFCLHTQAFQQYYILIVIDILHVIYGKVKVSFLP